METRDERLAYLRSKREAFLKRGSEADARLADLEWRDSLKSLFGETLTFHEGDQGLELRQMVHTGEKSTVEIDQPSNARGYVGASTTISFVGMLYLQTLCKLDSNSFWPSVDAFPFDYEDLILQTESGEVWLLEEPQGGNAGYFELHKCS